MNGLEKLLSEHPDSKEIFRFINTDALQSQISAGIKYKTPANNRHRVRFNYYSGVLVLKGHGTYALPGSKPIRIGPGDFFQRFPMQVHSTTVDPDEPWVEVYLDLPAALFSALSLCSMTDASRHVFHPGIPLDWVRDCIALVDQLEACEPFMLPSIQAQIVVLLERMLSMDRMARITEQDKLLETARELLAAPGERRSAVEIADYINMGYENFRKLFRQRYGMSPNQYRIAQRIFVSQDFLSVTGSVRSTASMLGYCDEFAFSKQFRQHTGMSPWEYMHMNEKALLNEHGERLD